MSLVDRVISDAVENESNSASENSSTFENTAFLRSREVPADNLEPKKPTSTAEPTVISVISNI